MLPNKYFENDALRKYIILFGRMFNNVRIERDTSPSDATKKQHMIVPIAYGGREKYMARNTTDPAIERPVAAQLPRMAFELVNMHYDPQRQLSTVGNQCFMPTPYRFYFNLYITARYAIDASKIVEQIAPFFRPSIGIRADLLNNDIPYDLKLTMLEPDMKDNYEGAFLERRVLIWTLRFSLDGWLFGPEQQSGGIIRWASINIAANTGANTEPSVNSNTYPILAGTDLEDIEPSDPYTIRTDITEFFDE